MELVKDYFKGILNFVSHLLELVSAFLEVIVVVFANVSSSSSTVVFHTLTSVYFEETTSIGSFFISYSHPISRSIGIIKAMTTER